MRRVLLLLLVMEAAMSAPAGAATLGPWQVGSSTNGAWQNNGVAGASGHLYTVTLAGGEVAPILPGGSLGSWALTSSPNFPRAYGVTLTAGSYVYIAGGHEQGIAFQPDAATVEVAPINPDGTLGPWSYTSTMNVSRTNHAGAVGGGRIYMIADYAGSSSVESAAILSDGTLGLWRLETSMSQSREGPGAAVVGDFLYVIGGLPFTTSVERAPIGADGVLGPWEYVASTQKARYRPGASAFGSLLFAVGGYNDGDGPFDSVEVSDFTEDGFGSWSFATSLTNPYWNANATAVGDVLYAMGSRAQYSGPDEKWVEFASLEGIATTTTTITTTSTVVATSTTTTTVACVVPDGDADGEADTTDRCPGTPHGEAVDGDGCSHEQFCGQFDVTTPEGKKGCKKADWKNDEPAMKRKEADCVVGKGVGLCVPVGG